MEGKLGLLDLSADIRVYGINSHLTRMDLHSFAQTSEKCAKSVRTSLPKSYSTEPLTMHFKSPSQLTDLQFHLIGAEGKVSLILKNVSEFVVSIATSIFNAYVRDWCPCSVLSLRFCRIY